MDSRNFKEDGWPGAFNAAPEAAEEDDALKLACKGLMVVQDVGGNRVSVLP
jgi:hypothetical protein